MNPDVNIFGLGKGGPGCEQRKAQFSSLSFYLEEEKWVLSDFHSQLKSTVLFNFLHENRDIFLNCKDKLVLRMIWGPES